MNIANLIIYLQKKMSTVTDPLDLLTLNKAVNKLKAGAVETVTYYSELPDATANVGKLFYVVSDERLYWSFLNPLGIYDWSLITKVSNNYLWSWGSAGAGQLGNGTTVNKSSPISIIGGFSNWCNVYGGFSHAIGLTDKEVLWSWGCNSFGQLGDGTTVNKSSPVSIVGGFTNWTSMSSGVQMSLGLNSSGIIWSWGQNSSGQLGDGTTVDKSSPVSVVGGFTDWCQVSGYTTVVGLRANGTAWSWGGGPTGQLGDGTTIAKSSPVSVIGGFTDWIKVEAGGKHISGLRSDGTIWAWGCNQGGQLGDGTIVNKCSPISIVGGFTDWCDISAGYEHNIALRTNGTAWAWGFNTAGRLGDGTTVSRSSPVSVVGGFTDWCDVNVGRNSNLGLRTNGTLWSWGGSNLSGNIGDGTTVSRSSPVSVVGGFADWSTANASSYTSFGIRKISF